MSGDNHNQAGETRTPFACRVGLHRRWDRLGAGMAADERVWLGRCVRCGDRGEVSS